MTFDEYSNCPSCKDEDTVRITASIQRGKHAWDVNGYYVEDVQTHLCTTCGADMDNFKSYEDVKNMIIQRQEEG